ncbi:MAG: MFS transporter [Actinobacteria bacterium]|nr:MFS transporter [Actinomycetota bacterium]
MVIRRLVAHPGSSGNLAKRDVIRPRRGHDRDGGSQNRALEGVGVGWGHNLTVSSFSTRHCQVIDERTYQRRWKILLILCISLFMVVVDNLIINVALPTLSRELGASTSGLQWIVDSYALVFACLLLAFGGLGDRFGRRQRHCQRLRRRAFLQLLD